MKDQALKSKIMRRIYGVWFVRFVAPRLGGAAALLWIAVRATADNFFVTKVVANFWNVASSNVLAVPQFIESAMSSAEPSVLFLISACGLAGFVLSVKLLRAVRSFVASRATPKLDYQKW